MSDQGEGYEQGMRARRRGITALARAKLGHLLRSRDFWVRRYPDFQVALRMRRRDFIRPPRDHQRSLLLTKALDEFADDLRALDVVSKRFVPGSERVPLRGEWKASEVQLDSRQLVIEGQQVMQEWERSLMRSMANVVAETHGDILEVGFGMGISASYIQECRVRSHTIIEVNDDVVSGFWEWRKRYPERDIRLIHGKWQDVVDRLGMYDGVFFDPYPTTEDEFTNEITFAESFLPTAAAVLRTGGIFTYLTGEVDSFSRRHQRLLFKYFRSITLSVVEGLAPPEDCTYWWADSHAVVKAVK